MGLITGMDEAGYGPNLGPLVIAVTVWEVPGDPQDADLWDTFAPAVCRQAEPASGRVHIADSKEVHQASKGLSALERSAQAVLALAGTPCAAFSELQQALTAATPGCPSPATDNPPAPAASPRQTSFLWDDEPEAGETPPAADGPWTIDNDLPLPHALPVESLPVEQCSQWQTLLNETGIRLKAIRCDVVPPRRFNQLTRAAGSKGLALSRLSLALLQSVWQPEPAQPSLVFCDKHGGRNRYAELLSAAYPGQRVQTLEEGRGLSGYQLANAEIRFQMRAEEHLPVAAASIVAKYLRELAMEQFNRYWQAHLPDLKPTKGYPMDARRFQQDIAATQQSLGIPADILWRER